MTGNFNRWFGVEMDVSGYYKTYPIFIAGLGTVDVKVTDYAYVAGPRINFRPFFAHALLGGDHLTGSALGFSESQDGLAGAFGGGVEWPVSKHIAVRGSSDYVFTRHNIFGGPSYTQNNVRASVGIVYMFGGREDRKPSHAHREATREVGSQSGMPIPSLGILVVPTEQRGAQIIEVMPGGAADMSGIHVGDVINTVDGKPVHTPMELAVALSDKTPGAKVNIGYLHGYWQAETVTLLGRASPK